MIGDGTMNLVSWNHTPLIRLLFPRSWQRVHLGEGHRPILSRRLTGLPLLMTSGLLLIATAGCGTNEKKPGDQSSGTAADSSPVDSDRPAPAASADPAGEFVAVDTSRLTTLPYRYELVNAFPKLHFGNERPLQVLPFPIGTDQLAVICQSGKIYLIEAEEDSDQRSVFMDMTSLVSHIGNEEGLLGLAFHPKFEQNGLFYVTYSANLEQEQPSLRLSRFQATGEGSRRGDLRSEEILMTIAQPYRTQNGGSLEFGPDGYLYIGLGDGGSANDPLDHGQNLKTLLGSVLRIDVDGTSPDLPYKIPEDNPFADRGDQARGEIWAYGFRNVWRLAFDRETGQLWAGDVGQDRFEEINVVRRGGNYGWNKKEGKWPLDLPEGTPFLRSAWSLPQEESDEFVDPIMTYYHSEGRAVIGGRVYRGQKLPDLYGLYLYGDFFSGNIWAVEWDGQNVLHDTKLCSAKIQMAGFGEDHQGEIYLCAFDGNIYRLQENSAYQQGQTLRFPAHLSETGLFVSTAQHQLTKGVIPYSVNVPLWSDYSLKLRFLALPVAGQVEFSDKAPWHFPVGTVIGKTFSLEQRRGEPDSAVRLETRILVKSPSGWEGYTYMWNEDQTDAALIDSATTIPFEVQTADGPITQEWYFPSRSDCKACHTNAGSFVLALNTRQFNRVHDYPTHSANQLAELERLGVFSSPLPAKPDKLDTFPEWNGDGDLNDQVRAYLEVNCAFCHAPGGPGNSPIDLRYHTSLDRMGLIGFRSRGTRTKGPPTEYLVSPGRPRNSELLIRMELRGPGQMPVFATSLPDPLAIERVTEWIRKLPPPRISQNIR